MEHQEERWNVVNRVCSDWGRITTSGIYPMPYDVEVDVPFEIFTS